MQNLLFWRVGEIHPSHPLSDELTWKRGVAVKETKQGLLEGKVPDLARGRGRSLLPRLV
jgi:hypothetical protein